MKKKEEEDYHYHIIEKKCRNHCGGRSYRDESEREEIRNKMTEWDEKAQFGNSDRSEKGHISK